MLCVVKQHQQQYTFQKLLLATAVTIAVIISCCCNTVAARSNLSSRNDAAPKGCKWQRILVDQHDYDTKRNGIKHLLSCKLRTLSGIDGLLGNLSVYQTDRISSLKLECNDGIFVESSLEASKRSAAIFGSLAMLEDLRIDFCKIRNIPPKVMQALRNLKSLSLRTHNAAWGVNSLDLHPESFSGLMELKELDLAYNNIIALQSDIFCPLLSLRQLNLTFNRINDIAQLSFSDEGRGRSCNSGLDELDISYNRISYLSDNKLSTLRSLTKLNLQNNFLTTISDRAFTGLQSLTTLNISSNRLIELPQKLFEPLTALTQLYLQNNTLALLPPGLLEGLHLLEVLDISQNELTSQWINRHTFAGLIRLIVLNLSYNGLITVDQNLFQGMYSLQILNLEHNRIELIGKNAFSDLKNLHALTLSNNKLKHIESYHLSDLFVLNQLFLESNEISTVHSKAFENLTNLNDLSISDNQLTDVPNALQKLRFLKSLDLGKNKIKTITKNSFAGLDQLLGLRLVDNMLENITSGTFQKLSAIHVINLASNKIKYIDSDAFRANPTIRAIRLDNNQLQDLSNVFTSLPNLVWLNVSDNKIKWFNYNQIPQSLEWLDMHKNNITELGSYFDVPNPLQIKMIDISFNGLTKIDETNVPDSIETLFVNNNRINEVGAGTFLKKKNIEKVVLYGNNIKKLDIGAFALMPVPETRDMPQFYIGDNPIHCDCSMEWLQRINELSHLRQHPRVLDLDLLQCTMEHERGEIVRPLMDLKTSDFLCKYDSHCFSLCHCCDFDACDCKMTCPDRCSCYHDHVWNTNVVDCGTADYMEVPEQIPMDATAIYLDGNNLRDLDSHLFIGKKKLELLFLNNSKVMSLHNRTLNGVPSLKVLHLEDNKLVELRGYEFDQLPNLSELYLDHNAISFVGNNTFSALKSLEVLNLSHNKIVNFAPWKQFIAASESGSLTQVSLDGIKFKCDCLTLGELQKWINEMNGEFDISHLICVDTRNVAEVIKGCTNIQESEERTSTVKQTVLLDNGLIGGNYVPLLAAIIISIISTALLIALACLFRQHFRLWVHKKYGIRICKDPSLPMVTADANKRLYDAYFVYSVRDADFSSQILAAELHHIGYNLCLHYRDIHSEKYLTDSIKGAAELSRKIVLIVSISFLQNEWSNPKFRAALQSVIENIPPIYRKQKLVLILTAPAEYVTVDPIMQILVHTCTVLCWGEKRFWDKLRFALPDISSLKKGENIPHVSNLRYTPAPSSHHQPPPGGQTYPGGVIPIGELPTAPSQSTSQTDDESSYTSSQHYEVQPLQNYACRSNASSLGHEYSTILEAPQPDRRGPSQFV